MSSSLKRGTDHPRSRGVYRLRTKMREIMPGSSPLARGLPPTRRIRDIPVRIIPARAGFTPAGVPQPGETADHPRSRGVYIPASESPTSRPGSSPLARGLRTVEADRQCGARIIPARAGFTSGAYNREPLRRDHPRSRGVYRDEDGCISDLPGSSPLARGLPRAADGQELLAVGSSPLARGLPITSSTRMTTPGIIPARAGFT